jgi:hypothetical protein
MVVDSLYYGMYYERSVHSLDRRRRVLDRWKLNKARGEGYRWNLHLPSGVFEE